jgi:hypothetical protein
MEGDAARTRLPPDIPARRIAAAGTADHAHKDQGLSVDGQNSKAIAVAVQIVDGERLCGKPQRCSLFVALILLSQA